MILHQRGHSLQCLPWMILAATSLPQEPDTVQYWYEGAKDSAPEWRNRIKKQRQDIFPLPVFNFTEKNLSAGMFDHLIRQGRPFVVRGLGQTHPMATWDCEFWRSHPLLGKLQGRREYAENTRQPQWKLLKEILRTDLQEAEKKDSSPYYVGLKDALQDPHELEEDSHYSPTWSKEVLKFVNENSAIPKFMQAGNIEMIHRTPEFWFVEAGGGGAKAHVDAHAESTWSLQLCGQKRWRISPIAARKAPHVMKLYQDGQIYGRAEHLTWNLFEDVFLSAGVGSKLRRLGLEKGSKR